MDHSNLNTASSGDFNLEDCMAAMRAIQSEVVPQGTVYAFNPLDYSQFTVDLPLTNERETQIIRTRMNWDLLPTQQPTSTVMYGTMGPIRSTKTPTVVRESAVWAVVAAAPALVSALVLFG